jgi:hypothetical protein
VREQPWGEGFGERTTFRGEGFGERTTFRGEGFGERTTFRGEGFGERTTLGRGVCLNTRWWHKLPAGGRSGHNMGPGGTY